MAPRALASALLFFAVLGGESALAQNLSLNLAEGRVTLHANGVTARQILAEWARQAQVQIEGAERLAPQRLTLQLDNVAEAEALEIVLRQASGYILAPRPAGTPGRSVIDRILILPVSAASAAPARMRAVPPPMVPPPVQADEYDQPPTFPGAPDEPQNEPAQDYDPTRPPFQPPQLPGNETPPPAPPPPFSVPLAPAGPAGEGPAPSGPVIVDRPGVLPVPQQQQQQQPQPPNAPPTPPSPPR